MMSRIALSGLLLWQAACGQGQISCFVRGTRISTPRGAMPIEQLTAGQEVHAYDEGRRQVVVRRVLAVFHHAAATPLTLRLSNGRELGVTPEHPIYHHGDGRYAPAAALQVGDELLGLVDPAASELTNPAVPSVCSIQVHAPLVPWTEQVPVFNLHVEGEQNYFAEGVLVHNKTPVDTCVARREEVVLGTARVEPPELGVLGSKQASSCQAPCTSQALDYKAYPCLNPPTMSYVVEITAHPRSVLWPDAYFAGWTGCSRSEGTTCYLNAIPTAEAATQPYDVVAHFSPCGARDSCPLFLAPLKIDSLEGMWVGSDGLPWFVTNQYQGAYGPVILKWDGQGFVSKPGVRFSPSNQQVGIWGTADGAHYTVGKSGSMFRDGQRLPTETISDLLAVWGTDANNVWAVGASGAIVKWDGTRGRLQHPAFTLALNAVWGSSASDVWAVGQKGVMLHFDGTSWSVVNSGTSADLWTVFSSSPNLAYAAGAGGTILRWDGTRWAEQGNGTIQTLYRLHGSNSGKLWAGAPGTS